MKFQKDCEQIRLGYRIARAACRITFGTYFRCRILHADRVPSAGGVLMAANHQSFLDPIAGGVGLGRECSYIARDTLFTNPLFGKLIRYVNAFPVKRGEADVTAVKELLRRLRDGKVVLIFPEGTRSHDGSIGALNSNSLELAKRAKVPIVPLLIDGTFSAFPRGKFFPRPYRIHIVHGRTMTRDEVLASTTEQIVETVTSRLIEAQAESRALRERTP